MSKMKAKIQAIIAKAQSTTHEGEAETLMAKAIELMERHQIDAHDLGEDDPQGKLNGWQGTPSSPSWQRKLMSALARYYGARSIMQKRGKEMTLVIVGPESARVTVEVMYPFIVKQVRALGRELAKAEGTNAEATIRRVANALTIRVIELTLEQRSRPAHTKAGRNALTIVGTDTDAYFAQQFPHAVAGRRSSISTGNDSTRDAANKVSLNKQTNGSTVKRLV